MKHLLIVACVCALFFAMGCSKERTAQKYQSSAAKCYMDKDYKGAVKWYRKGAELGDAQSQYMLGQCYFLGQGVVEDNKKATKWLQKAAEQGHKKAKEQLEMVIISAK